MNVHQPLRLRSETGETLVEVLMSMALMALVIVGMLGGIATMVIGSKTHRDRTNGNTALVAAMEHLRSPATTAPACSYTSSQAGVQVTNVEAQINQVGGAVDFSSSAACPWANSPPTTPLLLQRITLQQTADGQTLSFVKGKN